MNILRHAALILAITSAVHARSPQAVTLIPRVEKGPALTGDLSDPVWQKGQAFGGFTLIRDGKPATQPTSARVLYDADNLYVGVTCHEANPAGLVTQARERDGKVWADDCIEFLLDTANSKRSCCHLIANSIGTLFDEKCISADGGDASWDSGAVVKTGRTSGAWTLEMAIPFRNLGIEPVPGLVWGINICRARYAGAEEFSSWSPTPDGFVQPKSFGEVMLSTGMRDFPSFQLLSWGNLDSDISYGGKNVLKCQIPNPGKVSKTYTLSLAGKDAGRATVNVGKTVKSPAGVLVTAEIPYSPAGKPTEIFAFSVTSGGKTVFRATHPSQAIPRKPRVWQTADPLFTELLSENPPGLQKDGSIYWFHSGNAGELRPFAKEYGLRYSLDEAFKELADNKLMPIIMIHQLKDPEWIGMAEKHGVKALFEPDYRRSHEKGVPVMDGLPYILDPRSKEVYLEDLKAGLEAGRKLIWGVYTYDELTDYASAQGVRFFSEQKDSYPFIREADAEVREKFGYGKYGIPESPVDENPFRWIAYHKWVNSKLLEWQKDVYEYIQANAPEVRVISMDPVAGHKPYDLDRVSPYVDIMTHQLYPSSSPNRQEFGFVTKFVADLTGKPVWPCTHVEHYAYATTAEEVRELMSQVMRNGGKGFHLYIPDVRGGGASAGDTQLTKYGSPERYRAITEILKTSRSMNEVALPEADCAIFYSEDHYQSFAGRNHIYPNEVEYAYTLLGPVARTWFDIINDNMVADGKDLSKYKAIFVPAAKYERRAAVLRLVEYAANGGTLVLGGPDCFSLAPDGSSLDDLRRKLIGPAPRQADSAMGRNRVGKGRVVTYASNPFTDAGVGDGKAKDAFTKLARNLGLKTGRDIWRFKFPEFKTVYQPDPTGRCLTGNYVKWHQEKPLDVLNVSTGGVYKYSLAPDAVADQGGELRIGFDKGDLTDRRLAPVTKKTDLRPADFVVSWKTEQPVSVTFDLQKPYPISRVHLWYSDQLPELTVMGSAEGVKWVDLAAHPKQAPTKDVLDVELKARGTFRYVRLSFGQRDAGQMMTLVECEVWAK